MKPEVVLNVSLTFSWFVIIAALWLTLLSSWHQSLYLSIFSSCSNTIFESQRRICCSSVFSFHSVFIVIGTETVCRVNRRVFCNFVVAVCSTLIQSKSNVGDNKPAAFRAPDPTYPCIHRSKTHLKRVGELFAGILSVLFDSCHVLPLEVKHRVLSQFF